jgi:hypothetical protein
MTILDTYLGAQAVVRAGRALPRAAVAHRHLHPRPFVVVCFKMPGEAAGPLGFACGTHPHHPTIIVAPEPRTPDIRFAGINAFAHQLLAYLDGLPHDEAPQVVVPNVGTARFLGLLGRSVRNPGRQPRWPATTTRAGQHLSWLAERVEHPGSSVLLPLTTTLTLHWQTGQSPLEDAKLATVVAWISPPPGTDGPTAATQVEHEVDGPATDPDWDNTHLLPRIEQFNAARAGRTDPATVTALGAPVIDVVTLELDTAWNTAWRALELLRTLPPAGHVPERWAQDRTGWANHLTWLAGPTPYFANVDSPYRSAMLLDDRERAQATLDAAMVVDDPLLLAGLVAQGKAIVGQVTRADYARRVVPPGGRNRVQRPLLDLVLDLPCRIAPGTELWWTERPDSCQASVVATGSTADGRPTVSVELRRGLRSRSGPPPRLPALSEEVAFTPLHLGWQSRLPPLRRPGPGQLPWTHRLPPAPADQDD